MGGLRSWLHITRRTIDAACHGGGEHWSTARGTDRLERGSQPEPDGPALVRHAGQTHKLSPRSSGIEHRFPKVLCRTKSCVERCGRCPGTRLFFRLIRDRSRAGANGREDAPEQVTDGADRRRTLHRSPENRKVGTRLHRRSPTLSRVNARRPATDLSSGVGHGMRRHHHRPRCAARYGGDCGPSRCEGIGGGCTRMAAFARC
jgi:hypothetical protein